MLRRLTATRELGILFVLAIEIAVFALLLRQPGRANPFLDSQAVLNAVEDSAVLGLAAVGSCLVIVSGGIDLAVGSIIALVAVVTAWLMQPAVGWPAVLAVAAGLLTGAACGAVSGLVITRAGLPPFIVTLGMMSVVRGLAFLLTGGRTLTLAADSPLLERVGDGALHLAGLRVPVLVLVLVAVAATVAVVMGRAVVGRQVLALGGNEEAARLSGVPVARLKVGVYAAAGLLAGLAGCAYLAAHGAGQSTAAVGWELDAIAAAVLGGASLSGGRGSVVGACLGALIFRVLLKGLTMLGASRYQQVIIGAVVIVAVIVDQVATARMRAGRERPAGG